MVIESQTNARGQHWPVIAAAPNRFCLILRRVSFPVVLLILSLVGCKKTTEPVNIPPDAGVPFESFVVAKLGSFRSPARIALAKDGILYVTDAKRGQVGIISADGKRIGTLTGLRNPLGVAVYQQETESAGTAVSTRVYVGDVADGTVKVFEGGKTTGMLGSGAGEFKKPNAIATTLAGLIHVVDSEAAEIRVYDTAGKFLRAYGASSLKFPTDLIIDEKVGEVFVSDFEARKLFVYDLEGNPSRTIERPLNDKGDPVVTRIIGLGTGPEGRIYLVDNALCAVAAIDRQGVLVETFGYQNGRYWTGEVSIPIDAVSDGKRLYVTSNKTGQVHVFEVKQ